MYSNSFSGSLEYRGLGSRLVHVDLSSNPYGAGPIPEANYELLPERMCQFYGFFLTVQINAALYSTRREEHHDIKKFN